MSNVSFEWSKIVRRVGIFNEIDQQKYTVEGGLIQWSKLPKYPSCQVVDLAKYFDLTRMTPSQIYIELNKMENLRAYVNVNDKEIGLIKRGLKSDTDHYDGVPIIVEDLMSPIRTKYFLTISQMIHLETDSGINCTNYPTKIYSSYRECDETFVYKRMKNVYKIMPFWAVDDLNKVTNLT